MGYFGDRVAVHVPVNGDCVHGRVRGRHAAERPKLLDLFCGQGGASMGYALAGFDVTGVDIKAQPRYPFKFVRGDALEFPLEGFDAYHASPPCQAFTQANAWNRGKGGLADRHEDLLTPMLGRLRKLSSPWVVENVVGAGRRMRATLLLRGDHFGLRTHRPRLFESNVLILQPQKKRVRGGSIGVYGRGPGCCGLRRTRVASSLEEAQEVMGMPWADWDGCREAIPPAYTEFIGKALLEAVTWAL